MNSLSACINSSFPQFRFCGVFLSLHEKLLLEKFLAGSAIEANLMTVVCPASSLPYTRGCPGDGPACSGPELACLLRFAFPLFFLPLLLFNEPTSLMLTQESWTHCWSPWRLSAWGSDAFGGGGAALVGRGETPHP